MVLDIERVKKWLIEAGCKMPQELKIACFDQIGSTNDYIKEAISRAEPEWTLVTSLEQLCGYGRQGRSWVSPQGGLYLSILLRPFEHSEFAKQFGIQHISTLSLVLSIALTRLAAQLGVDQQVQIKWPNDVVRASIKRAQQGNASKLEKLGGISVELLGEALCVGIGLNVFRPLGKNTPSGKYQAAYIGELGDTNNSALSSQGMNAEQLSYMEEVFALLLLEVRSVYNQWLVEGFLPFRDEYRSKSFLQGQAIQVLSLTNDILYEGVVCDVDADGLLCLQKKDGSIVRAHSGEVHLI